MQQQNSSNLLPPHIFQPQKQTIKLIDQSKKEQIDHQFQKYQPIKLWHGQLSDIQMNYIIQINTHTTTNINFQFNQFTPSTMCIMFKGNWTNLTNLYLGNNQIKGIGCKYLSRINNKALEYLDISNNQIGNQGLQHITKKQWSSLKALWLINNNIGNSSLLYFYRAQINRVTQLFLDNNPIDEEGIKTLACLGYKNSRKLFETSLIFKLISRRKNRKC